VSHRSGYDTAMRDEGGSDKERRDERRNNDCGYRHTRRCRCAQLVLSSLISRSRYLSFLIAVLTRDQVRGASLLAVLVACGPGSAAAQDTTIHFEYEDARLYVPVSVNHTAPRWLILDTGASPMVLDANVAESLGLTVVATGSVTGAGTHSLRQGRTSNVLFTVGTVSLGPVDAAVSELDSVLAPSQGRAAPGIVGSRFFKEHVVEIDFDSSLVRVWDSKTYRYTGSGVALPLTFNEGVPLIAARMTAPDGTVIPMRLVVDLGAKSTLLVAEPFIRAHDLMRQFPRAVVSPLGAGVGGPTRYAFARIPRLALGSAGDALVTDSLVAGLSVGGTLRSTWYDALLGAEFLERYRVIFDYSRSRVILEPRVPPAAAAEYDMSGMFLLAEGPDRSRYVVSDMVKGGPAEEAGIAIGDTIVAVNGTPARSLTLGAIRRALKTGAGREVRLEVERGGRRSTRVVRLRRLV